MRNYFVDIFQFFEHRKTVFYLTLFSLCICCIYYASKIEIKQNVMHMLPKDKNIEAFANFFENSKYADKVIVGLSMKGENDLDQLINITDSLSYTLQSAMGTLVESIEHKSNDSLTSVLLDVINNHLPIFLDSIDYSIIDSLISDASIKKKLNENLTTLSSFEALALKDYIYRDPLGIHYLAYNKLKGLQFTEDFSLYDEHFLSKDERYVVLFINPSFPSANSKKTVEFTNKLEQIVSEFKSNHNLTNIIYFGAPIVSAGNAKQINKDTRLTLGLSVILIVLLISLFFKKRFSSIIILIPVVFGALFSLAIIYLIQGDISVMALAGGSLILGIAINYSLHFLTHLTEQPNRQQTIVDLTFPMTIGSLTTILGFLSLQFVNAPVLNDLGLFAAFSLIGAALATLIILPQLVPTYDNINADSQISNKYSNFIYKFQTSKYTLWIILILTPIFLFYAKNVTFENDLNKINFMSRETQTAQDTFNKMSSQFQKSVFLLSSGNSLEEAQINNEKLHSTLDYAKTSKFVNAFICPTQILPSLNEQQKRISKWNLYWNPSKKESLFRRLQVEGIQLGYHSSFTTSFQESLNSKFTTLTDSEISIFKNTLIKNFVESKDSTFTIINILKANTSQLNNLYDLFNSNKEVKIFDRQFVTDHLIKIVSDNFTFISLFTSLIVLFALFLIYGRIELTLISFLPMVISWIWILGIMSILHIKFNIINIILSTFIFALGDDYCIFTMDGLIQKYAKGVHHLKSISLSIFLSVLTTLIGLGILIFSKHPAMFSIALISIIGILCVWIISQTLQPLLFKILITNRTKNKLHPLSFFKLIKTFIAFAYFVFGALLLVVIGFLLTKLIPIQKKKLKYLYHYILCNFTKSLMYLMANVKKKIINPHNENHKSPSIIIANHQSFLDILSLVMLHPKFILLTNHWVWSSPIFGLVVQMADYLKAQDAEINLPFLKEKIKEGYSIVIFPEGTRSFDGHMKRFHKGAFLLAEQLNVDILPIVLHGTGYCMSKGDFLLKNGQITIEYLPRILNTNIDFGVSYQDKTKNISKYFKQKYTDLAVQIEDVNYFHDQLIGNYILKGPILEWYMRIKLNLENNYKFMDEIIPLENKILDIGCGYGFLDYILAFRSSQRSISALDFDAEKISIASNGYLRPNNLTFETANILEYPMKCYDTIIISDVLHYLNDQQQNEILDSCIKALNPKGQLIIRDGIKEKKNRHKGTQLSEFLSTKVFNFNKVSESGLSFISSNLIYNFVKINHLSIQEVDSTKLTSNITFILKKS